MSYEQFVETIMKELQSLTGRELVLSLHTTVKNNGCERRGVTFAEKGVNISPTIYLEEYYEKFRLGVDVKTLARRVLEMYRRVRREQSWQGETLQDFESVKGKIIYKLVNREKNAELLQQVPYVPYLDLAILFYVLVELDAPGECMTTMLIRKEHLKWWKVTEEEVYQSAILNTEKLLPYEFSAMYLIIQEMLDIPDMDEEEWKKMREQENMYVLTNRIRNCGAAVMLYPGRLEMVGVYFKENYYILPSSIHELIVLPESEALPKEELECVVREVNASHVQEEEFLSDHVYYYDREQKKVIL